MMSDFLRQVPMFSGLSDEDLEQLCQMVEEVNLVKGEKLFNEGDSAEKAYVIKSGQLEILKASADRQVLLAIRTAGDLIGEVALFEDVTRNSTVVAKTDTVVISISKNEMDNLIDTSPHAARSMFYTSLQREKSQQSLLRQSEKMAQLGTLSAGLAHELNNPAASVARGAELIKNSVTELLEMQIAISAIEFSKEQEEQLDALVTIARDNAAEPPEMNAIARSDKEYKLEEFLEEKNIENAWDIAPILVNLNFDENELNSLANIFDSEKLIVIINYLGKMFSAFSLVDEVANGANRISSIVKALKDYSYLDTAPVGEIDLHEGIDNTLLILRNKLKFGISVVKNYDTSIPKVEAYGSELNQVWTNLIDNAADAMDGKGTIHINTKMVGEWVHIEIEDSGPGMSDEVKSKIFDPFFTTKAPGKGTGLGLDISYNIIVNKHRGAIKVFTQPGSTCFRVTLPVNFETLEDGASPLESLLKPSDEEIAKILHQSKNIAVVGISTKEERPAFSVPKYLVDHDYNVIPINPKIDEVFGKKAYSSLSEVEIPIDVVLVFRAAEHLIGLTKEIIALNPKPKVLWMQEGIINEEAGEIANNNGISVIMDQCIRMNHKRLKEHIQDL